MTFDEKFSRAYRASAEAALEPADLTDRILKATEAAKSSTATNTRKQAPFWRRPALIGACAAASLALVAALPRHHADFGRDPTFRPFRRRH